MSTLTIQKLVTYVPDVFPQIGSGLNYYLQKQFKAISLALSATQTFLSNLLPVAPVAHKWISSIDDMGIATLTQPGFSDLSGNISVSQMNSGTSASSSTFWRGDGTWAAAGGVTSIGGASGAITVGKGLSVVGSALGMAFNTASINVQPSGAGTTSTAGIMMGYGSVATITPAFSSRLLVNFSGLVNSNGAAATTATTTFRFGTGGAPSHGASPTTGTSWGSTAMTFAAVGSDAPMVFTAVLTGLTPGTAYWFDMSLSTSSGSATVLLTDMNFCAIEF